MSPFLFFPLLLSLVPAFHLRPLMEVGAGGGGVGAVWRGCGSSGAAGDGGVKREARQAGGRVGEERRRVQGLFI